MAFNYTFGPTVVCLGGAFVIWLCIRRILALSKSTYHRWRKVGERAVLSAVILVAFVVAGFTTLNAFVVHRFWSHHPAPGRVAEVDGYKMHIFCTGSGSPTLILEAGAQSNSTVWNGVQPTLSRISRVCSYDRAGFGWSDTRPTVRDADHVAAELHGLLMHTGVTGPVVLMGHSLGGVFVRDYVIHYPSQVAGIVFIDSATPFQDKNPVLVRAQQAQGNFGFHVPSWLWNAALIVGTPRLLGMCKGHSGPDAALDRLRAEEVCRLRLTAFSEIEGEAFHLSSQETVNAKSFGSLPILIISRDTSKGLPAEPSQTELDKRDAWSQMQEDLKSLSTRSRRIIAKNSGHPVMLDRPDLVEKEVTLFIEQIRGSAQQPAAYGSTVTE